VRGEGVKKEKERFPTKKREKEERTGGNLPIYPPPQKKKRGGKRFGVAPWPASLFLLWRRGKERNAEVYCCHFLSKRKKKKRKGRKRKVTVTIRDPKLVALCP